VLELEQRSVVETRARELAKAGDFAAMTTLAIESYGPEILGYLVAVARNETDADEAFAMFCEDLWRSSATFAWEASLRTWSYALARNAFARLRRDPHRRAKFSIPLSSPLHQIAERVRSSTLPHLRSELKAKVAELRAQLAPDEQTLLILRLDRRMSWDEIAAIMADEGSSARRVTARLRKRFERIKLRLRELVEREG
jgi:RNA polymerase sigma-70 factor, ECF subfamily